MIIDSWFYINLGFVLFFVGIAGFYVGMNSDYLKSRIRHILKNKGK